MGSPYFSRPSLFGDIGAGAKALTGAAKTVATAAPAAVAGPPSPTRTVKVRAHTRTIKTTPASAPVNTQSVRPAPAQLSTVKRFAPHYRGEPVAGYAGSQLVTRPGGGTYRAARPYYTDAYTRQHRAGPTGQASTQWNAAQVAQAHRIQVANYGKTGYIARSLLPGGLDEGGVQGPGKALSRGIAVASMLPGGGVGEAAGILGFGLKGLRGFRAAKDVAEVAPKVAETVAPKAAAKFTDTAERTPAAAALAQKHGIDVAEVKGTGGGGKVLSGDVASHHFQSLSPAAQAREGLKGARGVRGQQEAGYSVERGSRAAQIHAIYNDTTLSVAEREHAANAALRGALPKVYFGGLKDLTPDTLNAMKKMVMEHPTLQSYDKKTVVDALNNAHAGEVPTNSELDKIETVFGKATRDSLAKYAKETSKWKDAFFEVGNIPRSMMSAVDVSGVGRQGLSAVINHPIITGRNLPGMMRAAANEGFYQQGMKNLAARPNAGKYEMGRLAMTDLGEIGKREEAFASNLAEKLTGLGKRERSPVRWSARAYTYFLDHARADIYDHYDELFARAGRGALGLSARAAQDVHDPEFIKGLSAMINSLTGRGYSLGGLARGTSGKALNTVLFSPNLMASRFDLLNPVYYAKMPKGLRILALRHSLATVGALASTLELARLAGLHVGLDPRSADFAKIKVGNTRIDLAGGYQQTVRMLYQVAVGQSKSSSTGQVINLRSGKYGQKSVTDVLTNFFENKESPLASITSDFVLRGGKSTIGQKMTPARLAGNYLTPMLLQDLRDIYNEKHGGVNGLAWALGAAPLGAVGVGLQTYGPPAPKVRAKAPSDYFSRGSSGGGSDYFNRASQSRGAGAFSRP